MSIKFFDDIKTIFHDTDDLLLKLQQELQLNDNLLYIIENLGKRLDEANKEYPIIAWKSANDRSSQSISEIDGRSTLRKPSTSSSSLTNVNQQDITKIPDYFLIKSTVLQNYFYCKKSRSLLKLTPKKYCCLSKVELTDNIELYAVVMYKKPNDKYPLKVLYLKDFNATLVDNRLLLRFGDLVYEFEAQTVSLANEWYCKIEYYKDYIKLNERERVSSKSSVSTLVALNMCMDEIPILKNSVQTTGAEEYDTIHEDHHSSYFTDDDELDDDDDDDHDVTHEIYDDIIDILPDHQESYDEINDQHLNNTPISTTTPTTSNNTFTTTCELSTTIINYDKYYLCLYDYDENDFKLKCGDLIEFIKIVSGNYFIGKYKNVYGLIPFNHVIKIYEKL